MASLLLAQSGAEAASVKYYSRQRLQQLQQAPAAPAFAGLVNGGFESGLSPWVGGSLNTDNRPSYAATALRTSATDLAFGYGNGGTSQSIVTTSGAKYTVTAWIWDYGSTESIVVNGTVLAKHAGSGGNGAWSAMSGTFIGSGASTAIQFVKSGNGYAYLDDAAVAQN